MKKVLLSVCTLGVLFSSSCKKSDSGSTSTPSNTWTLLGASHTSITSTRNANSIAFADAAGNSLAFYFKAYPTTDGSYNIIDPAKTQGANDVIIQTLTPSPLLEAYATGTDSKTVAVKVTSGKVSMVCSSVLMKTTNSTGDTSTTTLSTNISE
jgi:hypothetical protein